MKWLASKFTKILKLSVNILLFLALSSCSDSETSDTGFTISGKVSGATEAVSVRLQGDGTDLTVTPDVSGNFSFTGVKPGKYKVVPRAVGKLWSPEQVELTVQGPTTVPEFSASTPPDAGPSARDLEAIDAAPDAIVDPSKIILPNGQTLEQYNKNNPSASGARNQPLETTPPPSGPRKRKNDAVQSMLNEAIRLSDRSKWVFAAEKDSAGKDDPDKPAQNGLGYVYGSRTVSARTKPNPPGGCTYAAYGVDCSGLMYIIANAAGIALKTSDTSATLADPKNWPIPSDWRLSLEVVTDGTIQAGDVVVWSGHIGIAINSDSFISSTGAPGDCEKNIKKPRGPRALAFSAWKEGGKVSPPSKVLRLVEVLSGDYNLYLRCVDQTTDAAKLSFSINPTTGGAFSSDGSGTDYDGTPLCFRLNGSYDAQASTIDAQLAFCDGSRVDGISTKLAYDDTGYIAMSKVKDNGGCSAAAKLIRVDQDNATPLSAQNKSQSLSRFLSSSR